MLDVQCSCFAICFPSHIMNSNYLPMSRRLCCIRGTCYIFLLGVYCFLVRSIFRWWRTSVSNNYSFRLKHAGVPDGSDGSDGTSYPLTENYTWLVAQAMGYVAYLPCGGYYTMPLILVMRHVVYYARRSGIRLPLLCIRNVVTWTHHQNDTYVTLLAGVGVMQ